MKLFLSAIVLTSICSSAFATQDDPLAHFPTGIWVGTYQAQDCITKENYQGTAKLIVNNPTTYYPGQPSEVTFNGSLVLDNFPNNYNSYAYGIDLKDNQSHVLSSLGSAYPASIAPKQGEAFSGNYIPSTNTIQGTISCPGSYQIGFTITAGVTSHVN